LSDTDEPDLWQKDLTGSIVHWIEVGLPEEKRLIRASGRAMQLQCTIQEAQIWFSGGALTVQLEVVALGARD